LQIEHNRSTRGLQGMIFTRDDRAGEGKLSSRLGLVTDAVEAAAGFDFYAYLVAHLSKGGGCDYVIADEAQFLAPEQVDQLARVVDDLDLDVFAFGITTEIGYEVLCRRHHRRQMTAAGAHAAALSPDVESVEAAEVSERPTVRS
ncbi:hypothetical protein HRW21_38135, partial [Streptomyces lunaelactis]|nr:hypothetical protein [Streptomyces lunaelactis]NUK20960.1 hypothetical protein [Streptomyces lunaelactis]